MDDVARGVGLTLEKGAVRRALRARRRERHPRTEFYGLVERLTGVPVPKLRIPDGVAKAAGAVQKGWARLTGGTPKLTPDLVEIYRHDWAYSSARAERELGYAGASPGDRG